MLYHVSYKLDRIYLIFTDYCFWLLRRIRKDMDSEWWWWNSFFSIKHNLLIEVLMIMLNKFLHFILVIYLWLRASDHLNVGEKILPMAAGAKIGIRWHFVRRFHPQHAFAYAIKVFHETQLLSKFEFCC